MTLRARSTSWFGRMARAALCGALAALPLTDAAAALPATAPQVSDATLEQLLPTDLSAAVTAYRAGFFAEALAAFDLLAQAEPDDGRRAVLHANAGTAAARAERFGEAVWHLREALRLSPRDALARRNLRQVQARIGGDSAAEQDLSSTLARLPLQLTRGEAHIAGSVLFAVGLLLIALRRAGVGGRRLSVLALSLALLAAGWWALDGWARARHLSSAVVLEPVAVRGEPSADGKLLFRLDPGTLVRHDEARGGFALVETSAGGRGWLPLVSVRRAGG